MEYLIIIEVQKDINMQLSCKSNNLHLVIIDIQKDINMQFTCKASNPQVISQVPCAMDEP